MLHLKKLISVSLCSKQNLGLLVRQGKQTYWTPTYGGSYKTSVFCLSVSLAFFSGMGHQFFSDYCAQWLIIGILTEPIFPEK